MRPKVYHCLSIARRFLHSDQSLKVGVLGVPFDKGQAKKGVGNGPEFIRKKGLLERIAEIVRGGMTLREGIQLMEILYRTGRLGALDLVEVNPSIGTETEVNRTIDAAIHVIMAALGHCRRGIRPKNVHTLPLQTFPPTRQVI